MLVLYENDCFAEEIPRWLWPFSLLKRLVTPGHWCVPLWHVLFVLSDLTNEAAFIFQQLRILFYLKFDRRGVCGKPLNLIARMPSDIYIVTYKSDDVNR